MRTTSVLAAAIFAALAVPAVTVAQTAPQTTAAAGDIAFCTASDPVTNASLRCAANAGGAQATGANSIAIGIATASGSDALAAGLAATASGDDSIATGFEAQAAGNDSIAVGRVAVAGAMNALAIGAQAAALDTNDVALGVSAAAGTGAGTGGDIAIGMNARAVGGQTVTIGEFAQGKGVGSVLIGASATDTLSSNPSLPPDPSTGVSPTSTGNYVISLGYSAIAAGNDAVAIGMGAQALMPSGIAIGGTAEQTGGVALGYGASAVTAYAFAAGAYANAQGEYSVALGPWANAQGDYSVALGEGSLADRVETVSVGNNGSTGGAVFQRQVVNLAAGTQPFDAVNLSQLNTGGSAIAGWIGGGAAFDAADTGAYTAPTFVLKNPYTQGSYSSVGDAITALDKAITDVPAGTPGAQGPAGPQGPAGTAGAAGLAGKDGASGSGASTDTLAVHYDSATYTDVTLRGAGGTQVRNVAAGTAPTDAVNVDQLQEALRSAKTYTDARAFDTLNQANAYTDLRVGQLNQRVSYALAAAASNGNTAAAVAAQDPSHHNRVAVSDGLASGVNAWTTMYQHITNGGVTWNVSLTGEQGGSSASERQVGVGVGYSW